MSCFVIERDGGRTIRGTSCAFTARVIPACSCVEDGARSSAIATFRHSTSGNHVDSFAADRDRAGRGQSSTESLHRDCHNFPRSLSMATMAGCWLLERGCCVYTVGFSPTALIGRWYGKSRPSGGKSRRLRRPSTKEDRAAGTIGPVARFGRREQQLRRQQQHENHRWSSRVIKATIW